MFLTEIDSFNLGKGSEKKLVIFWNFSLTGNPTPNFEILKVVFLRTKTHILGSLGTRDPAPPYLGEVPNKTIFYPFPKLIGLCMSYLKASLGFLGKQNFRYRRRGIPQIPQGIICYEQDFLVPKDFS